MATRQPPAPKVLKCQITGEDILWCGWGRPPKYSPAGSRKVKAEARAKLRARKKQELTAGPGLATAMAFA